MKGTGKISIVSMLHFIRLVYRSALFVMLLISYIRYRMYSEEPVIERVEKLPVILYVTWAVFVVEMIMRFFPSRYESPGCQKQFARNYIKSGNTDISIPDNHSTVLIALIWIVFNGIFGALHMVGCWMTESCCCCAAYIPFVISSASCFSALSRHGS
ncbi:MAG: hypothetical protein IKG87_00505 [Clostridia bacterium]|nr:hypothetical protein [Clostridia bacterium]